VYSGKGALFASFDPKESFEKNLFIREINICE